MRIRHPNRANVTAILIGVLISSCGPATSPPATTAGHSHEDLHRHHHAHDKDAPPDRSDINWQYDNYETARAAAEKRGVPLVIDVWATWCVPCVEMHRHVLTDERLNSYADRFIWLKLNTDDETNRFPFYLFMTRRWPTYIVVHPGEETEIGRLEGAQSLDTMIDLLDKGLSTMAQRSPRDDDTKMYFSYLREARRATFKGNHRAAAEYLDDARELIPETEDDTKLREYLITSLAAASELDECISVAQSILDENMMLESYLNIIDTGLECAGAHDDDDDAASFLKSAMGRLETRWPEGTAVPSTLSQRNRILKIRRKLYLLNSKPEGAAKIAAEQKAMLENASTAAASDTDKVKWDRDRAELSLFLGQSETMASILKTRVERMPDRFEPLFNLAWFSLKTGETDVALESARLAVGVAPDPERGEALSLLADIYHARRDAQNERGVRQFLVEYYQTLPPALSPPMAIEKAEAALAAIAER